MKKSHKDKPATQGDLDNVVAVMLKGFARIEDKMTGMATKDDIKNLEKKLEDKIDTTETKLTNEIRDVKRRVNDLEVDTAPRKQVTDHEKRIKKLETRVFPS